jgi:di/tricarboxylate transporter
MGTPANAIALGSGYPQMRDFLKAGMILVVAAYLLFMAAAAFWWPLLGIRSGKPLCIRARAGKITR